MIPIVQTGKPRAKVTSQRQHSGEGQGSEKAQPLSPIRFLDSFPASLSLLCLHQKRLEFSHKDSWKSGEMKGSLVLISLALVRFMRRAQMRVTVFTHMHAGTLARNQH